MGELILTSIQSEELTELIVQMEANSDDTYEFTPNIKYNGCTCQGNCDGRTSCGCQWG